jgi:hypothetical protein
MFSRKGVGFQFWHILSIAAANVLFAAFVGRKDVTFSAVRAFFCRPWPWIFFLIVIGVFSTA